MTGRIAPGSTPAPTPLPPTARADKTAGRVTSTIPVPPGTSTRLEDQMCTNTDSVTARAAS